MTRKIKKEYLPSSLTPSDRAKQKKSILEGKDRPKVKSFKSKRSSHVKKFQKKYGFKISDPRVVKEIISPEGKRLILQKGRGAYYSSGSRPNQTAESWARARLASALTGGPASKVDKKILDEHLKK